MAISIQTNVNSLTAQENLRVTSEFQGQTIQRLTSGFRINASGDDAAGLAVANKYRSQIAELSQGVRNANDGISALQIVDGGMNNISKMLDRMKTLATQSASSTFTGNRATLNTEFSQLLKEIDRTASNVGLNTNGAYNKNIGVYIGGGSNASNAKVSVDLSGAASAVDSKGLSLEGTSVAGAAIDLGAVNSGFVTGSMTFTVSTIDSTGAAKTKAFTATGGAGKTAQDVIDNLNTQVAAAAETSNSGITFALGSDGKLKVGGTSAFMLSTTGAGGTTLIGADKTNVLNKAMHNEEYTSVATADATGQLTFKNSTGDSRSVAISSGQTAAQQVDSINAAVKDIGIFAVVDGDGDVSFQSNNSFTWSVDTTVGASDLDGGQGAQTAADATLSATSAAESALARITNAVSALGNTQGRVGAGQNKLAYAIQLAQSQISNFSAAESRIRDTDVAAEAANLTKAQVLQQASMAAMAQANSAPQAVLSLLRG